LVARLAAAHVQPIARSIGRPGGGEREAMCAYAAHRFLFGRAFARQGRAYLRFRTKNQEKKFFAAIKPKRFCSYISIPALHSQA
jgi:hypothetical protein